MEALTSHILLIISTSRSAPSKRSYGHRLKKREEENENEEEEENEEEKRERRSEGRHWRTISNQKPKAGS